MDAATQIAQINLRRSIQDVAGFFLAVILVQSMHSSIRSHGCSCDKASQNWALQDQEPSSSCLYCVLMAANIHQAAQTCHLSPVAPHMQNQDAPKLWDEQISLALQVNIITTLENFYIAGPRSVTSSHQSHS